MNAIKIYIDGQPFLLKEPSGYDDYEFPTFIIESLPLLREYIKQGNEVLNAFSENPMAFSSNPFTSLPDVQYFKDRTGIIGRPFTMHDTELYILDRKVNVIMEVNFND